MKRELHIIQCPFCNFDEKLVVDYTTSSIYIVCTRETITYKLVEIDEILLRNIVFNLTTKKDKNLWFLDRFEKQDDMPIFKDILNYENFVDDLPVMKHVKIDPKKILSNN